MKRMLKGIGIAVVALVALVAFGLTVNRYIRVTNSSSSSGDIGIVEDLLFGGPMEETLVPPWTENYKRWDTASQSSSTVWNLFNQYGAKLTVSPELAKERSLAQRESSLAFVMASAVSKEYLAESNAELPNAWFGHFVPAMDSWQRGLKSGDSKLVWQGITHYNAFLVWMRSHKRSDFNGIR